jgi:hypothetical protein
MSDSRRHYCNCCRVRQSHGGRCPACQALVKQIHAAHAGDGNGPDVQGQVDRVERYRELAGAGLPLFGGAGAKTELAREQDVTQWAEKSERLKLGVCPDCGRRKLAPRRRRCGKCLALKAARFKAWYERKKAKLRRQAS